MSVWGSSIPLTPLGQSGVWIPQSFSNSVLSSGWAAPRAHAAVPLDLAVLSVVLQHYVCSPLFLGGRAPCEHTVALSPLFLWTGESCRQGLQCFVGSTAFQAGVPLVCAAQWEHKATPCSMCWINLRVTGPLVCMLQCSPVSTESSSRRGGWSVLQSSAVQAGQPENLGRVPTCYAGSGET